MRKTGFGVNYVFSVLLCALALHPIGVLGRIAYQGRELPVQKWQREIFN